MSGAWRELRKLLGHHVPDGDPATTSADEKAQREADVQRVHEVMARVAEKVARIQARERDREWDRERR
jgi:uncharacterized protein (UPF0254 family)